MSIQQNYGNIKPSLNLDFANTKQLDPRITYSRASTGTYYDGKTVAKAEENLLLWSQEFQNTGWLRSGAAIAADTSIAPDGTTTADTLTASAGSNSHLTQRLASVVANQNYTYTVYAKYATAQYIAFGFASGALGSAWAFVTVDIQNGTITQTTNGSNLSSTALGAVTSVGNGWYRITVTGSHSQTDTYPTIHIVNTSTPSFGNFGAFTWTAAGTETVLLWGAQLEQRSFATAYTPTTTAPITNYIPVLQTASAGTPRFDHNPITGESLGLLIEEQRTNLLTYSSDFDNPAWAKNSASVLANALVSPDGLSSADAIIENTANTEHFIQRESVTVTSGVAYTISAYVKAIGTNRAIRLFIFQASSPFTTFASIIFNPSTGVVDGASIGTTTVVNIGNGWWRISSSATVSATAVGFRAALRNGTDFVYTGDGTSGIYIWGAQLEAGAFATSYIPTVASQVTRAADSASMTGTNFSSWYNQSEGSLFVAASRPTLAGNDVVSVSLNSGSASNTYEMYKTSVSGFQLYLASAGVTQAGNFIGNIFSANTLAKLAGAYKVNDVVTTASGLLSTADTSAIIPVFNQLSIGSRLGSLSWGGTISKIAYYPQRLTNTQLQALTS